MKYLEGALGFIKLRGFTMVYGAILLGGLLGFFQYLDDRKDDQRAQVEIQEIRDAVAEIRGIVNDHNAKLTQANQIDRETLDLITCLLAVHLGPEKFPTANQQLCTDKILGTSNIDGSFLSPLAEDSPSQPNPPPAPPPPPPSVIDDVLNLLGL